MKISIVNRLQNALTRMLIPFMIFLFYKDMAPNLIKYYAIGLAVSSILIFGFPLKINKSLKDLKLFIKSNQIFILYLIISTSLVFLPISLWFNLDYFSFIFAGFYFIFTHLYVSVEKYCQYYAVDKKGFYIFLLHNLFLVAFVFFFSFLNFDVLFFLLGLFFISIVFFLYFCYLFFHIERLSYLDIKIFFEESLILGQYSLMQNLISRGDSLLLPYLFNTKVFANYYLITRFVDVGGFLISMFSQLSLVESLRNKTLPTLIRYMLVGFFAVIISISALFIYAFFNNFIFNIWYFILFAVVLLKSILLYFQDLSVCLSKEVVMRNALCIQFLVFLFLMFFLNFFVGLFGVYFYFIFLIIMITFSLLYLFFLLYKKEVV